MVKDKPAKSELLLLQWDEEAQFYDPTDQNASEQGPGYQHDLLLLSPAFKTKEWYHYQILRARLPVVKSPEHVKIQLKLKSLEHLVLWSES